jgi:GMP synthase (glutamine-hydrolysing)
VSSPPRVLVIQPDPTVGLDRYTEWLDGAGLALEFVRPYAGDPVPDRPTADGMVVLGGTTRLADGDEYPWLNELRTSLRNAVESAVPTLAICLGAQLLAQAFGGRVSRGAQGPEIGVAEIRWWPHAAHDPLFGCVTGPFRVGTMHHDVVEELPDAATWLGYSETYPHQVFRVGLHCWGVQFHPELSIAQYRRWVANYGEVAAPLAARLERGEQELCDWEGVVADDNQQLAGRFAELVRGQYV